MQLNFDLISHNFGIKFFFFFNNSFFLVEMLFLSTLVVFFKALEYFFFSSCFKLLTPFKKRVATTVVFKRLLLVVAIQIFWSWVFMASFAPVLSYFYWSYFELNVFNEVGLNLLTHLTTTLAIVSLYFMLTGAYFTRTLLLISCSSSNFFYSLGCCPNLIEIIKPHTLGPTYFFDFKLANSAITVKLFVNQDPLFTFYLPDPLFLIVSENFGARRCVLLLRLHGRSPCSFRFFFPSIFTSVCTFTPLRILTCWNHVCSNSNYLGRNPFIYTFYRGVVDWSLCCFSRSADSSEILGFFFIRVENFPSKRGGTPLKIPFALILRNGNY